MPTPEPVPEPPPEPVPAPRAPSARAPRGRRLFATLAKLAALAAAVAAAGKLLSLFTVDVEVDAGPDTIDCTVFAPPAAVAGEPILVQVFVHLPVHEVEARALADMFDPEATPRAVQGLATEIARGSTLQFALRIPGADVDEAVASLVWRGRPAAVQFSAVAAPGGSARTLIGTLDVTQDSIPIGHVKFKVDVLFERAGESGASEPVGDAASRYRWAFLSYATADRDEVLRRAQMLQAVGIRFFQDIVGLDPGERWERRLRAEIERSDLFLLFWSRAAHDSEWVRREARWALECLDDQLDRPKIKPVILERPPSEPWPELAHLHFDDLLVYFAGSGDGP